MLVEGDSGTSATKIEVFRKAAGQEPFAASDTSIAAVVTDDHPEIAVPIWKRSHLSAIADNINQVLRLVSANE